MAYYTRKTVVLAKLETTNDTAEAAPTGGDAVLVKSATLNPVEGENIERAVVASHLGARQTLAGTRYATLDLEVEMAGSGTAGTAAPWGVLLQGCGMVETDGASNVVYAPTSTDSSMKSITIWYYADGYLHKLFGARGSFSLSMEPGQVPTLKFSFTAQITSIEAGATAMTGVVTTDWKDPVVVSNTNTPTFSLFGIAEPVMKSLSLDIGNNVTYRNVVNSSRVLITDRKAIGSCSIEGGAIDWFESMPQTTTVNATPVTYTGALSLVHGTQAGHIITLSAPKVQLTSLKYGDDSGIQMLDLGLALLPNSGNDELTLTLS